MRRAEDHLITRIPMGQGVGEEGRESETTTMARHIRREQVVRGRGKLSKQARGQSDAGTVARLVCEC